MKSKNLTYLMTHPLILTWYMILGFAMMFLLGRQGHNRYLQATHQNPLEFPKLQIGQHLTMDGIIEGSYGYGMLWFRSTKGERFIIKSTSTSVTHLTGDVKIQGSLVEYYGMMPVVNVYQYHHDQTFTGQQYRYDEINKLAFRPGYDGSIMSSGDLITVTDPIVNKEVIKIRVFECKSSNLHPNCELEALPSDEIFTSSNGLSFRRHGELWYVFGDEIGYRIRASDQYYLNAMSQYFDVMNGRFMADLVRGKLKTYCTGPQANVIEYVSHTIKEQNDNTFVIIRGLGSNSKLAICQLKMNIVDHRINFESITTIPLEG